MHTRQNNVNERKSGRTSTVTPNTGVTIQRSKILTSNVRTTRNNKRNKRKLRRKHNRKQGLVTIPEINQKPIQTRCLRYEYANNGPNTFLFTSDDIFSLIGFATNASTTFYPIIDSFRIRRIGVSLIPLDSTAGFSAFGLRWQGDNAPDVLESVLVGNAMPTVRSFFPPEGSTSWFWHDRPSTATDLWEFNIDNDGVTVIMDLELEYIIADGSITAITLANAPAFTGIGYHAIPIVSSQIFDVVLLNSVY